jgi:hypothetical protein
MNTRSPHLLRARWALLALAAAAAFAPAIAADKTATAEARAVYERELAACHSNASNQDQATCLREAQAAYAEARRGSLTTADTAQIAGNALRRCDPLPEADRKDCVARMQGQGTTRGSVAEGGIYRELVTREVGIPAPGPASAPAAK